MSSQLKEAVIKQDKKSIEKLISTLSEKDNWSLITIIDELLPSMLMESNLRFGSFHGVKMSLFLRNLAVEGYFSKTTEKELARIIALETVERDWVSICASSNGYNEQDFSSLTEKMIDEIDSGNVHNAFYYALGLYMREPENLMKILLNLGANAINKSLGHSISCFFPVVDAVIDVDHPYKYTALLTYVMYLSRYSADKDVLDKNYGQPESSLDYDEFLKICASDDGIVPIHHTITFEVAIEWEDADFNKEKTVPYSLLVDWVSDKEIDKDREKRMTNPEYTGELPETYEEFSNKFSFENLDESVPCVLQLLKEQPKKCVDWLFRIYAPYYTPSWDPHYYTSLYCALRLFFSDKISDEVAKNMAIEQALYYFAEDI